MLTSGTDYTRITIAATLPRNHLFASVCAYVKLEALKIKTGVGHFPLKSKIYEVVLI